MHTNILLPLNFILSLSMKQSCYLVQTGFELTFLPLPPAYAWPQVEYENNLELPSYQRKDLSLGYFAF